MGHAEAVIRIMNERGGRDKEANLRADRGSRHHLNNYLIKRGLETGLLRREDDELILWLEGAEDRYMEASRDSRIWYGSHRAQRLFEREFEINDGESRYR